MNDAETRSKLQAEWTSATLFTICMLAFGGLLNPTAHAALTDETQTTPNVPGGAIAKSLDEQVGGGHGDVNTPNTAVYLINRDPARSIRRGRQLFQRKFTAEQGAGPRVSADSTGDIRLTRELGAGLMDSCAGCHGRPRGSAGFGGDVVTRPDSRDAPHLFGLGLQEMLADEMTTELRGLRDQAVLAATNGCTTPAAAPAGVAATIEAQFSRAESARYRRNRPDTFPDIDTPEPLSARMTCNDDGSVTQTLVTKGVAFGAITAQPSGAVDMSAVEGVDPDLRIRPFFHQGGTISIREFAVGAFKAEMGLEAPDEVLCAVTDPDNPQLMTSPSGFVFDPSEDVFERPPVCDVSVDGDGDGVTNEIDTAVVDHMEMYLLNYFKPGLGQQTRRTREGRQLMDQVGCTGCHTPDMVITSDRRVADVETVYNPQQGIFNRLFATATTQFSTMDDGDEFPLVIPEGQSFVVKNIFTDFKRHDLGEAFHEREYDGTFQTEFLTEALWGVGTTAPYGHDGRSINLEEVIRRHGGEALSSRQAYEGLKRGERRKIHEFLDSLILFPPDDTASNLNPGNPDLNPQLPENHGSINLGELFQIDPDDPE